VEAPARFLAESDPPASLSAALASREWVLAEHVGVPWVDGVPPPDEDRYRLLRYPRPATLAERELGRPGTEAADDCVFLAPGGCRLPFADRPRMCRSLEPSPDGDCVAAWDRRAAPLVFAPMLVPGLLLVVGLYRLALALHLDGSLTGLWLAHSLFTAPYALVALAPAYRSFDVRYEQTAQALGRSRLVFLRRVKWPMLLAPIASAAAIGFAVSVTQYLSTQFVGAGRHATVTTEALTLASGGQRSVMAAFALLQALLPALAFVFAWGLGRAQARRIGAPGMV